MARTRGTKHVLFVLQSVAASIVVMVAAPTPSAACGCRSVTSFTDTGPTVVVVDGTVVRRDCPSNAVIVRVHRSVGGVRRVPRLLRVRTAPCSPRRNSCEISLTRGVRYLLALSVDRGRHWVGACHRFAVFGSESYVANVHVVEPGAN